MRFSWSEMYPDAVCQREDEDALESLHWTKDLVFCDMRKRKRETQWKFKIKEREDKIIIYLLLYASFSSAVSYYYCYCCYCCWLSYFMLLLIFTATCDGIEDSDDCDYYYYCCCTSRFCMRLKRRYRLMLMTGIFGFWISYSPHAMSNFRISFKNISR